MANRKRNQTVSIRLTTEEKKEIVTKATQAQMTLTDYLIECSSNTDITVTDLSEGVSCFTQEQWVILMNCFHQRLEG